MRVDQEAQYLQWENLYLRTLAEGASEGFCVLRRGLVIAYVNPPIEWFVRLTAPEIIGTRIDEFIAPEEREQARSLLSGLLARPGQSRATEVPFRRWDGRLRDVSLKIRSHPGPAENETFLTINSSDISFRKEIEKRLVSLGELKPGAVNSSQANIDMIVSEARMLENDDLIVYIRGGPGEAKSFGSGSAASGRYEEFASSPVFLESPVDCQEGPATFHDPERSSMDQPLLAEAAKYGLSCVTVFPVNFNGDIIGTLYAFGRPPERLGASRLRFLGHLARAIVMEERRLSQEQNLKDFIVVASHELRHPMAIIKGYSSILRQHADSLGDDERNSILDSIEKGVDRLSRLASELLDAANIEQGRFDSTGGPSDVAELVEKAIAQVSERNSNREYIIRVASSMPPVPVGPVALLLCLVHLIDNAVNFSVEGPVEIVGKTDDEGVKIQVLDRGIGVPEGQRRMIFSRFSRVAEARHHSVPGVGLGLFIADRIIRSQGGSVTCDGREGGGTVMTIAFPWEAMPGGAEERLT